MSEIKTCPVCGKTKPTLQFDWLQRQQKYHVNCKLCTKTIVNRVIVPSRGRPAKSRSK